MPSPFFNRPFGVQNALESGVDPNSRYLYYWWKWGAPPALEITVMNGTADDYGGEVSATTIEYMFDIDEDAANYVLGQCTGSGEDLSEECICFITSLDYYGGEITVDNIFYYDYIENPKCFFFYSFNTNCKDFVFYEHKHEMIAPSFRIQYGEGTYSPVYLFNHDCFEMLSQDTYGNLYTLPPNTPIDLSLGVEVFTHASKVY